jgi:hypothetical protein
MKRVANEIIKILFPRFGSKNAYSRADKKKY